MLKEVEMMIEDKDYEGLFNWAYNTQYSNPSKSELRDVAKVYELLADNGNGLAANNLGSMYYNGQYFKEDRLTAIEYYEMACDLGESLAYSNLAYCYYYGGDGLEVNDELAFKYFSEGATLFDDANCLYKLGDMYRYGRHVKQNDNKAFQLYARALNVVNTDNKHDRECLGDIRYRMGDCLLHGVGVPANLLDALFNLNLSLSILYERVNTDRYVMGTIRKAKALVQEIEELLEGDNKQIVC